MMKTRTAVLASAVALGAATVTAAPGYAAPAPTGTTGVVQYADTSDGSLAGGGSADNELVQVGLVLIAGLGVSLALAAGAGLAGGAFEVPQIPGLPF